MPKRSNEAFFVILFMAGITILSISVVSGIYLITEETIRLNESALKKQKLFSAIDISIPDDSAEIDRMYQDMVKEIRDNNGEILYYEIYSQGIADSDITGYVLFIRGKGLWGNIDAFVGIYEDRETLAGIDFLSQNETPGLGARITESWFREQFQGKIPALTTVPEGDTADESQFQAITGATFTINAVRSIINQAPSLLKERMKQAEGYE